MVTKKNVILAVYAIAWFVVGAGGVLLAGGSYNEAVSAGMAMVVAHLHGNFVAAAKKAAGQAPAGGS